MAARGGEAIDVSAQPSERAPLPTVLDLPAEMRSVLLDLERRGQLRRALEMDEGRVRLAAQLARLEEEHGRDAMHEALSVLGMDAGVATNCHRGAEARTSTARPAPLLTTQAIAQLVSLNVNQWRIQSSTDGWYSLDDGGRLQLFALRSQVPQPLLDELSAHGVLMPEAQGVAAGDSMTFEVLAGRLQFKRALALDIDRLRSVAEGWFDVIHACWDGAKTKYPVKVTGKGDKTDEVGK